MYTFLVVPQSEKTNPNRLAVTFETLPVKINKSNQLQKIIYYIYTQKYFSLFTLLIDKRKK